MKTPDSTQCFIKYARGYERNGWQIKTDKTRPKQNKSHLQIF